MYSISDAANIQSINVASPAPEQKKNYVAPAPEKNPTVFLGGFLQLWSRLCQPLLMYFSCGDYTGTVP
jgi:hypothetical protein